MSALFLGTAAQAADPCAAYMGRGDDDIGLVRCRDKYGGWNFGASVPTVQPCPLKKKTSIQNLQDITRYTERQPQSLPNYSASNADPNLLAQVKRRTAKQAECAAKAPAKPQRIVIAYDGLSITGPIPSQVSSHSGQRPSGIGFGGMRSNIISNGVLRVPNTQWQYHDETQARRPGLSDSIRCAYEWATKPYKNSKGETVYSSVTLVGYSFGGNAAFQTAETLRKLGITVDLMVTLDPRQPHTALNAFNDRKPASVGRWVNYYERNLTLLPGFPVQGAENHRLSFFGGLSHVWASHTSEIADGVTQSLSQVPVCRTSPSRIGSAPVSCN